MRKSSSDVKKRIRRYWDRRAHTYDRSPGHSPKDREIEVWKKILKEKIEGNDKSCVLDVGTGTGFLSIMLTEMGFNVVGLDISREMLRKAREKAKEMHIEFVQGDAENLPFKTESFDAVVNRAVLWTLPDPERALAEWKRVLKSGGRLCFFLHEIHPRGIIPWIQRQLRNILILIFERRNPWNLHRLKLNTPFNRGAAPTIMKNFIEACELEPVSVEPMEEINKLKIESMPLYYKIMPNKHIQYCYTAIKSHNNRDKKDKK